MISYERGDLLSSDARCLVNAVNCEGFMGKGLAYQFKRRFPKNNEDYVRACRNRVLKVGRLHSFEEDGKLIVNFPTKDKWREKSKIEYIEKGLAHLRDFLASEQIPSVAIPPLGCGNGGLQWNDVKTLILRYLSDLSQKMQIKIYPPPGQKRTLTKPSIEHLILIKLAERLDKKKMSLLQMAAFFFDLYARQNYFPMTFDNRGLISRTVAFTAKEIHDLKDAENFAPGELFAYCLRQIISKTLLKKLEQYDLCADKAVSLVNLAEKRNITQESGIVLYCLKRQSADVQSLELICNKNRLNGQPSAEYVQTAVEFLEEQGLVQKNLLGQYEICA